jgi:hypothetical protein
MAAAVKRIGTRTVRFSDHQPLNPKQRPEWISRSNKTQREKWERRERGEDNQIFMES